MNALSQPSFELVASDAAGERTAQVSLGVIGRHQVSNALAAAAGWMIGPGGFAMISISRTLFNQDGDDVSLELHVDEVGEEDQDREGDIHPHRRHVPDL